MEEPVTFESINRIYTKICAVCTKPFETGRLNKNICSFPCKQEHNRQHSRYYNRMKRQKECNNNPCVICGFSETTDMHREGKIIVILCPNHHCLITRNIKTLNQLLKEKASKEISSGNS